MIFLELFITFFKIGLFTFGGGYAMLPLIQSEVIAHKWIANEELIDFIAVSESTPGPFAVNISTYVGMTVGGVFGSVCSTLGVVLPSFIIILAVAKFFENFKSNKIVSGCMTGLKPAVIGLIGSAVVSVGKTVFIPSGVSAFNVTDSVFAVSAILFVIMTVFALKKVNPILIIVVSAVIGICSGFIFKW